MLILINICRFLLISVVLPPRWYLWICMDLFLFLLIFGPPLLRRRAAADPAHRCFIARGPFGRPMAAKLCHTPLARSLLFVGLYLYLLIFIDSINFGAPSIWVGCTMVLWATPRSATWPKSAQPTPLHATIPRRGRARCQVNVDLGSRHPLPCVAMRVLAALCPQCSGPCGGPVSSYSYSVVVSY